MTDATPISTRSYVDGTIAVHHGDALAVLRALPDNSVDAVVTDPPYGLEFMGKDWDSFRGDAWRSSAGITRTGYTDGAERLTRPSYGGGDTANPTCATCGGRKRGARKCACVEPDWRVKGKPLDQRDNNAGQMRAFQAWCEQWAAECLRVLKPGGHMLAFGGTRTAHRLACAVEDAGFEIRDRIAWLYASGFPKSLDVSKAIDKMRRRDYVAAALRLGLHIPGRNIDDWTKEDHAPGDRWWEEFKAYLSPEQWGAIEREVIGHGKSGAADIAYARSSASVYAVTAPATDAARQWAGWGTALKPAHEPIIVARKPLDGTVAANVQQWGTGAINIDACRVEPTPRSDGRWPSNLVLTHASADGVDLCPDQCVDGCPVHELNQQSGVTKDGVAVRRNGVRGGEIGPPGAKAVGTPDMGYGGSGGASRFFPTFRYQAKAPTKERPKVNGVAHPTTKPLELMRWLVRLVATPGATVLDPFAGSGTTVEACLMEDVRCIAVEREAEYLPLIEVRIERQVAAAAERAGALRAPVVVGGAVPHVQPSMFEGDDDNAA
jgi:site-specific DNA-methyltransferase (adenine-specific)